MVHSGAPSQRVPGDADKSHVQSPQTVHFMLPSDMWDSLAIVPGRDADKIRKEIGDELFKQKRHLDSPYVMLPQEQPERDDDFKEFLTLETGPSTFTVRFVKSGLRNRIIGIREVNKRPNDIESSFMSLDVPITSKDVDFVRGSVAAKPAVPSGLQEAALIASTDDDQFNDDDELRTVPPGFTRGYIADMPVDVTIKAPEWQAELEAQAPTETEHTLITVEDDGLYVPYVSRPPKNDMEASYDKTLEGVTGFPRLFDDMPDVQKKEERREWAHIVEPSKSMHNFSELVPEMAYKYPFELDNFQKQAIYHLEQDDMVFVAAHTSAGKTVVAEYAIALSMKHLTRCLYTSPIKALSNQKFREFKQSFGAQNVGIITGDVHINPEAPCLIMTTEVLRTMLYRSATLLRDVEYVIFDEVHYVNDQERGVVWEEVIIMLPSHVNVVLLSATVPNAKEFADWVGRTKQRDIYVISTSKRPVPLEHFLYAGNELYKIAGENRQFQTDNFHKAVEALKPKKEREAAATGKRGAARGGRGGRGGAVSHYQPKLTSNKSLWVNLVGMLRKRSLLPTVVFVFSKMRCEEYADSLPNTDLCTAAEKSEVHVLIERSLLRLREEDRTVPQITRMRDMLHRGIGVHHSGLLPIVKELVELLFQRGVVKVLFATETFAMGVNMPARSVVFSGIRKNDGTQFRTLLPGEYTQMSGRAGRRGLDNTGVVVILCDKPELSTLNYMILGQPLKLKSQFRITYGMILNLLRIETLRIEEMIKRSFSENATQRLLPDQQAKLNELVSQAEQLDATLKNMPLQREEVEEVYAWTQRAVECSHAMMALVMHHPFGAKCLSPGRVVLLFTGSSTISPALIVRASEKQFLVLVALSPRHQYKRTRTGEPPYWITPHHIQSWDPETELVPEVCNVSPTDMALVTALEVDGVPTTAIQSQQPAAVKKGLELLRPSIQHIRTYLAATGNDITRSIIDLEVDWSRLRRMDFKDAQRERDEALDELVYVQPRAYTSTFMDQYRLLHKRHILERDISKLRASMSIENLELLPDYHQRFSVLCELGCIQPDTCSITVKGHVASQIRSANELILADLIIREVLVEYEPVELAALLSVFHFRDKTSVTPDLTHRVQEGLKEIGETADRIANVQLAHQLPADDDSSTLNDGLVQVVYEWANGMQFRDIMRLTDVGEGTIVRCITRLDETFRELADSARVSGDAVLLGKMETCRQLCRRDIVFAASLYF
mgnify:FL=1